MSDDNAAESPLESRLLLGWDGLDALAVQLVLRGTSLEETRASLHPAHKSLAEDLVQAPKTATDFADEATAREALDKRLEALTEDGFAPGAEPITLSSFTSLPEAIEQHVKTALVPDEEGDQEILTRFGGLPRLHDDDLWPNCGCCESPLSFLAEIELPSIRESTQLFICLHGGREGACVPRVVVRIVDLADATEREAFPHTEVFTETLISKWRAQQDLPAPRDHRRMGLRIKKPGTRPIIAAHASGTKIGGWPTWGDFPERPRCESCCKPMTLELQTFGIPEDLLWGAPVGHIQVFQCVPCDRRFAQHVPH